jgi:hypothetical protein
VFDHPQAHSRAQAFAQLKEFIPHAGRYSRDRNHVLSGHGNVSRLSAAVRHRLVTEWEMAAAPRERYAASTVEKFTQEIYWRSYWKGWLSLRPQVWQNYRETLSQPNEEARAIMAGEGPIGVMNLFAKELRRTGYLHNHARMWFAGYWVHVARLPWQWGARFFEQELLDFDPASNTLSWRWVAGLQTLGKSYLPRRSNIEKYLDPQLLAQAGVRGMEELEKPTAALPEKLVRPPVTRPELESDVLPDQAGLWIHEEDLSPESYLPANFRSQASLVTYDSEGLSQIGASKNRVGWTVKATRDAASRHDAEHSERLELRAWAKRHDLKNIVTMRPEIGPLHDQLPRLQEELAEEGITLHLMVREEDLYLRPLAKAGFFPFWEKLKKRIQDEEFPLSPIAPLPEIVKLR